MRRDNEVRQFWKSTLFCHESKSHTLLICPSRSADAVHIEDGYDSLIVMSMLDREYQARRALELERPA